MTVAGVRAALRRGWPYAAVAAAAAILFARGPFAGHPLFFRDLSLVYFPFRLLALTGLREGTLVEWNPFLHEGVPMVAPAVSYPFDLLQLLRPDPLGMSIVLALHVPLAAVFMMALARRGFGLSPTGAAAGGLVYALGGFALSTVNLYVYAQALAWAPAAVLALLAAARGGRRALAAAAVVVGVLLSTAAAEMVGLTLAIAVALAVPCAPAALGRMAAAIALGAMLAAPTLLVVAESVSDSARAAGFPPDVVLSHSIHPLTLAQVVVAGLHGDPGRLTEDWWGENFFPLGFPYFLSLYLGLAALALAAVGAAFGRGPRRRLVAIAAVALALALGRWGIAGGFVEAFEILRRFRYPSKMYFAAHFAAALLAALGADALATGERRAARLLAAIAGGCGLVALAAPLWPSLFPRTAAWFAAGFFPPGYTTAGRMELLGRVLGDAAAGGVVAAACAAVAWLHLSGRIAARAAALAVVGLVAADLARAGAGLNPAASEGFFATSPEVARHHAAWRAAGRIFTCHPTASRAYAFGRGVRADHEQWTFAVMRDAAMPGFNVAAGLRSALGPDVNMMVAPSRLLDLEAAGCARPDAIIAPLRLAGVAHVISLDPLRHPDLLPLAVEAPPALAPVAIHAYGLRDPLPMVEVARSALAAATPEEARARAAAPDFDPHAGVVVETAAPVASSGGAAQLRRYAPGRIEVTAAAAGPSVVVVREGHAPGWSARVDGDAAPVLRANGRHLAVAVPGGTHVVRFEYRSRALRVGAGIAAAALVMLLLLAARA